MKRVEVQMNGALRGRVSDYASERDYSMPQAYGNLIRMSVKLIQESDNYQDMVDYAEENDIPIHQAYDELVEDVDS